ncbi:regulator of chromosome condensation isoform X4 [Cinclus cinclus]|uniref:regulator of chromosome condensation isoform X4 n=1 Tax=Cinclus cinclus TaxID=127875 RepID=UPI002E11DCC2
MPGKRSVKNPVPEGSPETKKVKVSHPSHRSQPGLVLTLGQGNVGQLGLGEDIMERKKPALVTLPEMVVQVEAGGMHTVCLSQTGKIYTFGCNDEGALGRDTSAEGSETSPGPVELQEKVVQVSAGDSHTAALTEDGRVFVWGSFRDNNGVIGLLEPMKTSSVPVLLQLDEPVVKIVSGNDHLVMLTVDGDLFTCGCGEQGQLGRVPALFANRGGRKGLREWIWFSESGCWSPSLSLSGAKGEEAKCASRTLSAGPISPSLSRVRDTSMDLASPTTTSWAPRTPSPASPRRTSHASRTPPSLGLGSLVGSTTRSASTPRDERLPGEWARITSWAPGRRTMSGALWR